MNNLQAELQAVADAVKASARRRRQTAPRSLQAAPAVDLEALRQEYVQLLKAHDWFYDYSDDHNAWSRGKRERELLDYMARRVDPDRSIWRQHAPR